MRNWSCRHVINTRQSAPTAPADRSTAWTTLLQFSGGLWGCLLSSCRHGGLCFFPSDVIYWPPDSLHSSPTNLLAASQTCQEHFHFKVICTCSLPKLPLNFAQMSPLSHSISVSLSPPCHLLFPSLLYPFPPLLFHLTHWMFSFTLSYSFTLSSPEKPHESRTCAFSFNVSSSIT